MYNPVSKDKVLELVREKGPVIPIHLKKDLNTDTILIGALLSQLVEEGKVKVSSVKIGSSPTYYAPGTEEKLAGLVRYLNEKDRRVAEMLERQKVMKDSEQDPLVRVCLRNIKDYAKPLEVSVKGRKEIYWKWFLVPTKEAEEIIAKEVRPKAKPAPVVVLAPKPAPPVQEEPKKHVKEKRERQARLKEDKKEHAQEKPAASPDAGQEKDAFFSRVRKYLEENKITILDYRIIRKTESDLTLLVPTQLGSQEYFCKAKNKKRISEGDLASAYLQGQGAKLPVIFLSPGEPSKKLKEKVPQMFKGLVLKRL